MIHRHCLHSGRVELRSISMVDNVVHWNAYWINYCIFDDGCLFHAGYCPSSYLLNIGMTVAEVHLFRNESNCYWYCWGESLAMCLAGR